MKTVRDGWSSGRAEPVPRAPRVRSAVRVTVIALTVGLIAGPFAPVGSASACASLEPKDWVTIPVPDFPAGNQVIADLDVSYTDPSLLFVTNGYSVLSSTDGGCSFREAFNLASFEADFDVATAAIADLHLASNDGRRVYLAVKALERVKKPELPDLGLGDLPPVDLPMEKPHVIVSSDGGQSWTLSDTGLEDAYGPPLSIVSTPDSESAYLLVDQGEVKTDAGPRIFTPQKLYASTSGGSSWAEMQVFGDPAGVDANGDDAEDGRLYAGLESDPADPKTLWAFGPNGLQKSIDGGASFVPPSFADALSSLTGVSGVETYRGPKGPTEVLAFPTGQSLVLYSNNGGTTFVAHPEPGPIESAALADGVRFAAATTTGEAYYHFPTVGEPIDISLQGSISGLEAVLSGEKDLIYGHTVNAVVRRVAPDPPPGPVWEFPLPEVFDSDSGPFPDIDDHCKLPPALLLPADREVVLEPGESETLSYRTAIPGVIQADVAFLSDVSGSMAEEIAGLKNSMEGIVLALDEAGICLWGGVAQYRDYSSSLPYQRLSDIQPPGSDAFKDAFGQLIAGGGEDQTALAALHNLATGEGSSRDGQFIAPDQQMNFRPGLLHVVVHGTDEEPSEDLEKPPHSYESAAEALNGVGVRHIGLAYENDEDLTQTAITGPPDDELRRLSTLTHSFARDLVDCTGDGQPDLQSGDPLTCAIPPAAVVDGGAMGLAIANMIMGLPDFRSVSLDSSGDDDVVTAIMPTVYNSVDFRKPQQMDFDVTVQCPTDLPDDEYQIDLSAIARAATIAEAKLTVVCQSEPPALPPAPDPDPIVPAIPPFFPPPNRPPQLGQPPVTQAPANQAQAQQQAQQQAQAQAGLVAQRNEQPQVAAVKVLKPSANLARVDGGGGDDLSFSSYRPRRHGDPPLYLFGYVVAAALGSAFGLVVRARARRSYVVARARRRDRARRTLRHWN